MESIKAAYDSNGFGESLPFTSDNIRDAGFRGTLEGALVTANLQSDPSVHLDRLLEYQPNRPVMIAEYWAGWFTPWFHEHATTDPDG